MRVPTVSFIVATRNRAEPLRACLEKFSALPTEPPFQVVVVDNGSSDETSSVLADALRDFRYDLKGLCQPRRGKSRALNLGLEHAGGEYLTFTDDDCYVSPDIAAKVVEVFTEDPRLGFALGRVLLYDKTDASVTLATRSERIALPPYIFLPAGIGHGANMTFRRAVITTLGGFSEHLGPGTPFAGDDINTLARASWSGYCGAYDPRIVVYHHHGRKPGPEVARLLRHYDRGRGAYYAAFLSNPQSRRLYAANWYWSVRSSFAKRRFGSPLREMHGALHYWVRHGLRPLNER
jgi:glycosyltransferase involved in cell wall biosynthesis